MSYEGGNVSGTLQHVCYLRLRFTVKFRLQWGHYQRPGKVTDYFSQPGPAKVTRAV